VKGDAPPRVVLGKIARTIADRWPALSRSLPNSTSAFTLGLVMGSLDREEAHAFLESLDALCRLGHPGIPGVAKALHDAQLLERPVRQRAKPTSREEKERLLSAAGWVRKRDARGGADGWRKHTTYGLTHEHTLERAWVAYRRELERVAEAGEST
jgi:hypothetical protein